MPASRRPDLIKTLKSLGDRLVVPHQALRDFWRRRQRLQDSPRGATKTAADALAKSGRSIRDALDTWAKAVGVDDDELSDLTTRVDDFLDELKGELQTSCNTQMQNGAGTDHAKGIQLRHTAHFTGRRPSGPRSLPGLRARRRDVVEAQGQGLDGQRCDRRRVPLTVSPRPGARRTKAHRRSGGSASPDTRRPAGAGRAHRAPRVGPGCGLRACPGRQR